jgi:predicted DNA-binding protein (UPF0251 family)
MRASFKERPCCSRISSIPIAEGSTAANPSPIKWRGFSGKKIPKLKAGKAHNPLDELWAYAYNLLMARPLKCRCIECRPNSYYFKPRGIPLMALEEVSLRMDELEALRLADYQGLYHEEAATKMEISRATFGRVLNEARRKVAEAILQGKALKIETPTDEKGEQNEGRFCRAKR